MIEYSALQSTTIGLRGVVGPFVGIWLMNLGLSQPAIFAIGCGLIATAWLGMGSIVLGRRVAAVGSGQ